MNLERAKEILDKEYEDTFMGTEKEWKEAVRLGSEAMKRCQLARKETSFVGPALLPGETKD